MNDSPTRSLIKTVSWRITGSGATFSIAFIMTGDLTTSGSIAGIQIIINTALYFIHERVWNKIKWGKDV